VSFPYRTIGIVPKVSYERLNEIVEGISEWMRARGSRLITMEPVIALPEEAWVSREEFEQLSEMIMILGGDGTFLQGGKLSLKRNVPILGVNLGRLGFLTEITEKELVLTLEKIEAGQTIIETRHLLQARVKKEEQTLFEGLVINDAVVTKSSIARMLELETRVEKNFLANFKADGLIISTPTGSTAYSLAAGGPIVFPTMEAIIMTPICAHSLNHRPLVVPDHLTISVHVQTPAENAILTLDGQTVRSLEEKEYIQIAKSHHHLRIIKSPFKSYFDILKSKLRWAET
jgi:NAD+ kinase